MASLSFGLNRPYKRRNSLMISLWSSVVRCTCILVGSRDLIQKSPLPWHSHWNCKLQFWNCIVQVRPLALPCCWPGWWLTRVLGVSRAPMVLPLEGIHCHVFLYVATFPLSVDWYDGSVPTFLTRPCSSLLRMIPFGQGCNDGRTHTMAVIVLTVLFGELILMCLLSTPYAHVSYVS
jgi:hypothetical protein